MGKGDPYALLASLWEDQGRGPMPPRETLERAEGGKPFFLHAPFSFSLSHSGDLALCALSGRPVGADVELVRPRRAGFPRYALSDREFAWFQDRGGQWEDFYTLWTLKEAKVKCTGEGLRQPPRTVAAPLLPPGESIEQDGFSFTALAGQGWRGAICEQIEKSVLLSGTMDKGKV
jgi:phosphopantetheinyl transferase